MLIRNPALLRAACAPVLPDGVAAAEDVIRAAFAAQSRLNAMLLTISAPEAGLPVRAFGLRRGETITVYTNPRMSEATGAIKRFPVGAPYTGGRGYWLHGYPDITVAHDGGEAAFSGDEASAVQHDLALLAGLPVMDLGPPMEKVIGAKIEGQRVSTSYLADVNLAYPRLERNAPCWCQSEKKWKRCHGRGM